MKVTEYECKYQNHMQGLIVASDSIHFHPVQPPFFFEMIDGKESCREARFFDN